MAKARLKRIRKSYIAPDDKEKSFPRKELTWAVAEVDDGLQGELGVYRILAFDVKPETLAALADNHFSFDPKDIKGFDPDAQATFEGWGFEDAETAAELFKILKLLRITCWSLEVHR